MGLPAIALLTAALAVASRSPDPGPGSAGAIASGSGDGPPGDTVELARESLGPLRTRENAPLHRLAYTPVMSDARTLAAGEWAAEFRAGWSNVFEEDSAATHRLLVDTERLLTSVTLRWGASDRLELAAATTFETSGGGILDGAVEGLHDRLGLSGGNRGDFPRNAHQVLLRRADGTVYLDKPRRRFGLDEFRISATWAAGRWDEGRHRLSLRADLRIPGTANRAADERADGAVMALGRTGSGPWTLHAMAGASVHRSPPELREVLRPAGLFGALGLERRLGSRLAALVQWNAQSPTLRGFGEAEIDRPSSNIVLGLAGLMGRRWGWQFSIQEDLPPDTPATDFTLALVVHRRW